MALADSDDPDHPEPSTQLSESLDPATPVAPTAPTAPTAETDAADVDPETTPDPVDGEPTVLVIEVRAVGHEFGGRRGGEGGKESEDGGGRARGRGRGFGFLRRPLRRPRVQAIDEISFGITAGESVGFIGPRGVGKTTMVELLTGVLSPSRGLIRICGRPPTHDPAELSHQVGVVYGLRPRLWPDLPLAQSLRILAAIHRLPERRWIARRTELVERLGLASFLDLPIGQLSIGRRIRGEVAAALLHEPELVILDEPTAGLDAHGKERLRTFLRQEHRVHGRTVLVTSSDIGDVEQLCDRLLVVDHGRLAYDGDLHGLIDRTAAQRVLVVDLNTPDRLLDDVPGTELLAVEAGGLRQRLSFPPGGISTARVLADVTARAGVRDLSLQTTPIEDVVRNLVLPV